MQLVCLLSGRPARTLATQETTLATVATFSMLRFRSTPVEMDVALTGSSRRRWTTSSGISRAIASVALGLRRAAHLPHQHALDLLDQQSLVSGESEPRERKSGYKAFGWKPLRGTLQGSYPSRKSFQERRRPRTAPSPFDSASESWTTSVRRACNASIARSGKHTVPHLFPLSKTAGSDCCTFEPAVSPRAELVTCGACRRRLMHPIGSVAARRRTFGRVLGSG